MHITQILEYLFLPDTLSTLPLLNSHHSSFTYGLPGLRHLYRHYFNSSLPSLKNLLGEKPHTEIINFLKEANFYHYIWFFTLSSCVYCIFYTLCFILCHFDLIWMGTPSRWLHFLSSFMHFLLGFNF